MEELNKRLDILFDSCKTVGGVLTKLRHNRELSNEVKEKTYFISTDNLSQKLYHVRKNLTVIPTCLTCGKIASFNSFNKGYYQFCNTKCSAKHESVRDKCKETCIEKYRVENTFQSISIKNKIKKTCRERYGVDYIPQAQYIKNKVRKNNLKKYGVTSTTQIPEIKKKQEDTLEKNYGVRVPLKSYELKEKVRRTCLDRYGVNSTNKLDWVREKQKNSFYDRLFNSDKRLKGAVEPLFTIDEYVDVDKLYLFKCCTCGNEFEDHLKNGRIPICRQCYPFNQSSYEIEIKEWLKSINIEFKDNNRNLIPPFEIDVYLPDYNLAIEFNGLYWHSEIRGGKDRNYHLNKTKLCEAKGIKLIHIFEDEWVEKREVVKSIILNKMGLCCSKVYARKCKVKKVDSSEAKKFLLTNHLQKVVNSRYYYGLYYNNELIQLISLSKSRYNKNYDYELIRSCSKINISVVGGFNKLVKYATKDLNISKILSYVDRRYFSGSSYGDWFLLRASSPNYFYVSFNKLVRESRVVYQKHKLKKLFPVQYDSNLTEWKIMQLAGYDRIWDCGNLVYEWKK